MDENAKPPSKEERAKIAARLSREFLIPFAQVIDHKYKVNWHHDLIARAIEEATKTVESGKQARIILELPPRHGKSDLASIKAPAWILGKHPDWPVIIASYSADLAIGFGQATRDVMTEDEYKFIFNTRLRTDAKAKGNWLTDQRGGYTASGVGGTITGKGFKVGIVDDPIKNREEADSEVIREKIWKWWTSTFLTRQNEEANAIIVIATRWHREDLIGKLVEQMENAKKEGRPHDNWKVIRLPAIAEEDEEHRKKGEPLWPERFSLEWLTRTKENVGVSDWAALYQQTPILLENQEFREHYFRYYNEEDIKDKNLIHKTTVDPAISKEDHADNSVVNTTGKSLEDPNFYVREESAGKMDPLQLIDAIFYHQQKYRSDVYVETVAYQKSLKYFIEEEMRRRQIYFNIYELKGTRKKEERIRGLIPLYKTGVIHHHRSMKELEIELLTFPQGKHDDRADALAYQIEAHSNTIQKRKKKTRAPLEESRYEGTVDPEFLRRGDDWEKWENENLAKM